MPRTDPRDRRTVVRVDRSPMNPSIWCLGLSCGHDHWKPARTRPTVKTVICDTCKAARHGKAKDA